MTAGPERADTPLARLLKLRLGGGKAMTFADYMNECLHHPEFGYYARGPDIGPGGDFVTAASFPGFAAALADQFVEARERLGEPADFRIVEVGGGTGVLARDVCNELVDRGLEGRFEYVLVEASEALRRRQADVTGLRAVASLAEAAPARGVAFANEVLDALPFHRLVGTEEGVRELFVTVEDGRLVEKPDRLSTPALEDALGLPLEVGQVTEVSLLAAPFVRALAGTLSEGYVLLLDYGDEADVVHGIPRKRGTLRTYRAHRVDDDPFGAPGEEDVTADVDFSLVQRAARDAGLAHVGYVTQGRFLLNLGIVERVAALAASEPEAAARMKTLFLPGGMGERFKVAAFAKGAPADLRGFAGALTF